MTVREHLAARRPAIVAQWVDRTLATYPPATARAMAAEVDPFRNPAGYTLRTHLAALFDAVLVSEDWNAATTALEDIVRLRAVQDFSADGAIAFVAMLEPSVVASVQRDLQPDDRLLLRARIDRLTQIASDLYQDCRARIERARANELKRRTWNAARIHP